MQKHEDLRIWALIILSLTWPKSHFGEFDIAWPKLWHKNGVLVEFLGVLVLDIA